MEFQLRGVHAETRRFARNQNRTVRPFGFRAFGRLPSRTCRFVTKASTNISRWRTIRRSWRLARVTDFLRSGFPGFEAWNVFALHLRKDPRFIFERFHEQALRSARWLLAATAVKKRRLTKRHRPFRKGENLETLKISRARGMDGVLGCSPFGRRRLLGFAA